ncbi:MAG: hypothetical protein HY286_10055 [Planctomycetes bacterium]|nr:hypothetical protein [Planctomycetota bacterium]
MNNFGAACAGAQEGSAESHAAAMVENVGQWDSAARWRSGAGGFEVAGIGGGFVISTRRESETNNVIFIFEGASPIWAAEFGGATNQHNNYIISGERGRWSPRVPAAGECRMKQFYPGVDLRAHFDHGTFEFDLFCKDPRDAEKVILRIDGADSIAVDPSGDLIMKTASGELRQHAPASYWFNNDRSVSRANVTYSVSGANRVCLHVDREGAGRELLIDPSITFSTFMGFGMFAMDYISFTANDAGETASAVETNANWLATTPGVYGPTIKGSTDIYIRKLNAFGGAMVYETFFGGNGKEESPLVAMDGPGNVYMCGATTSIHMPTTAGAPWSGSGQGTFISKLDPTGSTLLFSTYFSNGVITPYAIAADASGNAFVTGLAYTKGLLTSPNAYNSTVSTSGYSMFTTKMDTVNSSLGFGTYFSTSASEAGYALAPDGTGSAWILGRTNWTAMPTTPNAIDLTSNGTYDECLIKFNPQGTALDYASWLDFGGDPGYAISNRLFYHDPFLYIYFSGFSSLPATTGAYLPAWTGSAIMKIHPASATIVFATYVGVTTEHAYCGIDESGSSYFTRTAAIAAAPMPVTADSFKTSVTGLNDGHIMKLNNTGTGLLFASYFGADLDDGFGACAGVGNDSCIVSGYSNSPLFPITPGAFDTIANSYKNTTVRLSLPSDPYGIAPFGSGTPGCNGANRLSVNEPLAPLAGNLQFICNLAPANAFGALIISDQQDQFGSDSLGLGVLLHVGLNTTNIQWLDMHSDAFGTGFTDPLSIAAGAVSPGQLLYAQAFWLWPSGTCAPSPSGLSSSNGIAITIQP